jgi:hypothetical protein
MMILYPQQALEEVGLPSLAASRPPQHWAERLSTTTLASEPSTAAT